MFDATKLGKDETGKVIKESTFMIVAVPDDPSGNLGTYVMNDDQTPRMWIGKDSELDIKNLDLYFYNLWEPTL